MPNNLSFRSGQVILQKCRVESTSVIEPGDMVFLDESVARPASEMPWNTDLATTQQDFAALFLGIAHEQSADGETEPISIDVSSTSIYEFDVASSPFYNGSTLGPDGQSNQLLDQQLAYVSAPNRAIARTAEYAELMASRIRVTFASAFTTCSSNTNANIG